MKLSDMKNGRWQAGKPELLVPFSGQIPHELAISKDGSKMAVSQVQRESALWTLPLNAAGLAAGDPKPLIRDLSFGTTEPAFSSDGSKLAYRSARQGGDWVVFQANADGSAAHPVTPAGQSSLSASWIGSDSIAYLTDSHGKLEYWISPLQGAPKRLDLNLETGRYAYFEITRDGSQIAAHKGNPSEGIHVVVADVKTGAIRDLAPGHNLVFPSWSPDRRWISAVEILGLKTDNRVILNVATGELRTLRQIPPNAALFSSSWSADNDRVAFADDRDGIINLYWFSKSTGKEQQLTHFTSQSRFLATPAWSPRGDQIVFERADKAANIYVADLWF